MQNTNKNIHILTGSIVIDPNGLSGILCDHCNRIISASMVPIPPLLSFYAVQRGSRALFMACGTG
jgi:hypothetical protein